MADKYGETLLSQSKIWLFGRVLIDIALVPDAYAAPPADEDGNIYGEPPRWSANNFVLRQITEAHDPRLARIFGFSYENAYYDLARPAIFLVHGMGIDADTPDFAVVSDYSFLNRSPPSIGRTGLGTQSGSFAGAVQAWAYDRADFTMRLDADTGTFDTLLLSMELGPDAMSRSSGSVARASGSVARSSGSVARSSGSVARARRPSDD